MTYAVVIIALLMGTLPAAAAAWLDGEWCDPRKEERLLIDGYGLGFNEHTICEWSQGRPGGETFDTTASCANVYQNGDETVRMDERTVRLRAEGASVETIFVSVGDGEPVPFARCDG
ncbi:hypothetical protein [Aquamicrobium sp. LC103]|uniref:hypothetical protein n=1 Tax=Aquamicrobium sp. LC103 TaxID=1120658 RepID=UPI00063E9598|nr:hypothetical protein [Aquamicrobium sp. LC103]TKT80224.1 hypothetical protein XW59_007725 [Aquamicrobium sp. LC103]